MSKRAGIVILVGAGPGAVDLITVRGADAIRRADVVIYDYLVSPELLRLAPAKAELIYAGKKGGSKHDIEQTELNAMLVGHARKGRVVVRLKGGDPFIFGRGGEEAEALVRARVPFEVVPGVTSAIAAPAFAGIPLTHREHGSFVAFVTGHEDASKTRGSAIPWNELGKAARAGGTLVILMASARMRTTLERLSAAGLPPDTPCAAIQWGDDGGAEDGHGDARDAGRTMRARANRVAGVYRGRRMRGPARASEVVRADPLFGRTVVVTRAGAAAAKFADAMRRLGADVIEFPTIETVSPKSYATLDRAIARLDSFDWIIFTSATGVDSFFSRLKSRRHDVRELGGASIAAIGPATAARIGDFALKVAAMPDEYRAEAIVSAIGPKAIRGKRFLIPRAEVARDALPKLLREHGAKEVVVAPCYRTIKPKNAQVERIRELIALRKIDLVTFTSSSTVNNFCELVGRAASRLKAAAIGPITAETARQRGFDVVVSPREYTIPALTQAIRDYCETARQAASAGAS